MTIDDCGIILDPPAGTSITDIARLVSESAVLWHGIAGFNFNGHVIRCFRDDTADNLVRRYHELLKEKS